MTENTQNEISPEEFKEQKQYVNLDEIYFQSGNWEVDKEQFGEKNSIELGFDRDCLEKDSIHFKCVQKFTLKVISEKTEEEVVSISCNIVVESIAEQEVSGEFWDAYAYMTVPILTVPYFREFVFSLSGKMGIPPIHVPHWTPGN